MAVLVWAAALQCGERKRKVLSARSELVQHLKTQHQKKKYCPCYMGNKRHKRPRKKCVVCPQAKKMYEHKCRDKEEADQNVNRNTNTGNTKQIEKVQSDSKGQRDELRASLSAAPSSLSPCSFTRRLYKRSRMLRKQVPHWSQLQQRQDAFSGVDADSRDTKTILMWALPTFRMFVRCASLADMFYQHNVNTLAKAREDWIKEHVNTCEVKIV